MTGRASAAQRHEPQWHVVPCAQIVPQVPQFVPSFIRSAPQTPKHATVRPGHAHTPSSQWVAPNGVLLPKLITVPLLLLTQ